MKGRYGGIVRFDMPTFEVTKCGVLGGECQHIEEKLGGGTRRITAFVSPFMAGKHLYLEPEGQEGGSDWEESLVAAITWPALVLLLSHVRISDSHWLLQVPLPLPRTL